MEVFKPPPTTSPRRNPPLTLSFSFLFLPKVRLRYREILPSFVFPLPLRRLLRVLLPCPFSKGRPRARGERPLHLIRTGRIIIFTPLSSCGRVPFGPPRYRPIFTCDTSNRGRHNATSTYVRPIIKYHVAIS